MRNESGVLRAFDLSRAWEAEEIRNAVVFAALTGLGAKVYIPHEPVPFTLQTLFVILSGALLGIRGGTLSMTLYLLLGAAGIPLFAGAMAGPAVFMDPSAGYLFGFVMGAAVVGGLIDLFDSVYWTAFSMLTGLVTIFVCGTAWLNAFFIHNWNLSITQGFLIFSYWDLVKLGAAVALFRAIKVRTTSRTGPLIHKNKSEAQFSRSAE